MFQRRLGQEEVLNKQLAVQNTKIGNNLSDLRGDSDVEFVSTSEELAAFLSLDHQPPSPRPAEQYFDLDPELAGWRRCLAET